MSISSFIIFGACISLALSPAAMAQRSGAMSGVVHNGADLAIGDVEITALSTGTVVRTDSAGKFLIGALPPGHLELRFRRLGYEPVVLAAEVPHDDTTEVDVTLTVVAQRITGVLVQAGVQRLHLLDEFEERRQRGIGHFITRADVVKRNPIVLSDMARMIPGVVLTPSSGGRSILEFARAGKRQCPPQYWVDGLMVTNFNIDDVPPDDIAGIELYAGEAGVPPQFSRTMNVASCGTIIIWTRVPKSS